MWHIRRTDPYDLVAGLRFVALTGGGGKTSLMEHLAARAVAEGRSVAVTTTTKIYAREPFVVLEPGRLPPAAPFLRVGGGLADGKLTALSFEAVERLGDIFDLVFVEADGARGMPLKCPAGHEPVIPPFAGMVFVVAGLDGLGLPADRSVFRWEILADLGEVRAETVVDDALFVRLLKADMMMKSTAGFSCTVVQNKWDALRDRSRGRGLARAVAQASGVPVMVASIRFNAFFLLSGHRCR